MSPLTSLRTFFSPASVLRNVAAYAAMTAAFLAGVAIVSLIMLRVGKGFADQWSKDLHPITCTADANQFGLLFGPRFSDAQKARLNGQFREVRGRVLHHFNVTKAFYENHFVTVATTGILAAIAAITLLFITSTGWQPSKPRTKAIFVIATAAATYCSAIPSVFQQEQNMNENRRLYLENVNLANDLCSYAATGKTAKLPATKQSAVAFISYVDQRMSQLNPISVTFNASQNPNYNEALKEGLGGGQQTPPQ